MPKIFALGDLHGDIIPLIVCLRDCCKVISKKKEFIFKQDVIDNNAINELNKDWDDPTYIEDLNYEWCGNDSCVVLCGDLIDNARGNAHKKPQEFPFEEARLLKFINKLNKQAMQKNGRIYKVLGNHDMMNLVGTSNLVSYSTQYAQKNDNGYTYDGEGGRLLRGRLEYFKKGNPGAKLLGEDGAFLFLMLKDFIFVHGGLSSGLLNFNNINNLNIDLMKYINNESDVFDNMYSDITKLGNDITWDRYFGFKEDSEEKMCNSLYTKFKELCTSLKDSSELILTNKYSWLISNDDICNPTKMKLVIGHCNQNFFSLSNLYKSSFKDKIKENKNNDNIVFSEEFSGQVYTGEPDYTEHISNTTITDLTDKPNHMKNPDYAMKGTIYGTTVSCGDVIKDDGTQIMRNKDLPSIYRLDVGMSRAFNKKINGVDDNKIIYSRTPQILKIIYDIPSIMSQDVQHKSEKITSNTFSQDTILPIQNDNNNDTDTEYLLQEDNVDFFDKSIIIRDIQDPFMSSIFSKEQIVVLPKKYDINTEPEIRIVKSTLENTKIHVPLLYCDPNDECNIDIIQSGGNDKYFYKYIKYKKKYLNYIKK